VSTTKLIEQLEQILPGIQNSNSAAEAAMVEVLPDVIARLRQMAEALDELDEEDTSGPEELDPDRLREDRDERRKLFGDNND